jgi:hypothetical protein
MNELTVFFSRRKLTLVYSILILRCKDKLALFFFKSGTNKSDLNVYIEHISEDPSQ